MELAMNRRQLLAGAMAFTATAALIEGCNTSWITTALADIPTVSKVINSVVAIVALGDPGLSAAAQSAIQVAATAVQAGLATLQALIDDYHAQPSADILAKIDATLSDVQQNLSAILAVSGITSASLQATISVGVSLAIMVVQGVQALIPPAATTTSSLNAMVRRSRVQSQMTVKVKLLDTGTIRASFNLIAVSSGYFSRQI
jgi:hypothetical protein